MSKTLARVSALLLLGICCVAAAESVDFIKPGVVGLNASGQRGQKWELTNTPDGRPGHRLSWNYNRFKYGEAELVSKPQLDSFSRANFRLRYWSEGKGDLTACGLRLVDAGGEVFQISMPAMDNTPGWKEIAYMVDPSLVQECWGGDKNKTMDFPVKIWGFGIGFSEGSSGPVWFDRLTWNISETPAASEPGSFRPVPSLSEAGYAEQKHLISSE